MQYTDKYVDSLVSSKCLLLDFSFFLSFFYKAQLIQLLPNVLYKDNKEK